MLKKLEHKTVYGHLSKCLAYSLMSLDPSLPGLNFYIVLTSHNTLFAFLRVLKLNVLTKNSVAQVAKQWPPAIKVPGSILLNPLL